ncbi:MAG: enoyl-CoA hydratase/isomerase family protein, partial [Rhodobacteraceae bacterium]|nr:enoyl-CoA hydratase/isomerase family protein [Paracoccaceae bacterium]
MTTATSGGIARVLIDNPTANALSERVCAELLAAIDAAEADPAVMAVVIAAEGRHWSAGTDIRDLELPDAT